MVTEATETFYFETLKSTLNSVTYYIISTKHE